MTAAGLGHPAFATADGAPPPLVLHVIHRLAVGGLENGLVNLIDGLPAAGYRHAIACIEDFSDFRQRIKRRDVDVIALRRSQIGVWHLRRELYRLCRRLRPAIVHSRNLSGLDALLPARLAGVGACVHGEHGWEVDDLKGERLRPVVLRKLHSPLVSRYITVSKDLERYLVERVGIAPSRITPICNGVDADRFAPAAARPLQLLPEHLRRADPFVVGTVGRVTAVKDQATLVKAVARLAREMPALRPRLVLAIVGDGPLLEELRALAVAEGIADLAWFPGAASNVPELVRLFDVFVLPSLNEGISNTLLEAMAARLPVVATAVGGNVEIVEPAWGELFPPGDQDALVRILAAYANEPARRERQAAAARRVALERFSLKKMVENYDGVYAALIGRERACPV